MTICLSKTLEKCLSLHYWAERHKVSILRTAEAIQLCQDMDRMYSAKRHNKAVEYRNQAEAKLKEMGFTDVEFYSAGNHWPTFTSPVDGGKTRLPNIK